MVELEILPKLPPAGRVSSTETILQMPRSLCRSLNSWTKLDVTEARQTLLSARQTLNQIHELNGNTGWPDEFKFCQGVCCENFWKYSSYLRKLEAALASECIFAQVYQQVIVLLSQCSFLKITE